MRKNRADMIRREIYEGVMDKVGRHIRRLLKRETPENIIDAEAEEYDADAVEIVTYDGRVMNWRDWDPNARSGRIPCFIKIGDVMMKIDEDYTKMYTFENARRYAQKEFVTLGKTNTTYRSMMPGFGDMKVISDNIDGINMALSRCGYDELPDLGYSGDNYTIHALRDDWWTEDKGDNYVRVYSNGHRDAANGRYRLAHVIPVFRSEF